jgi:hypothetical protein
MKTEPTTDTTTAAPAPKLAKTATITLRAGDGTAMTIVAERLKDSARSYILMTDAAKKTTTRGMTAAHATFEEARAAIAASATKAEKLGWHRRPVAKGFTAKPDAFSALPAAPKASAAPKGKQ